jgi:hypothetical protein
MRRLSLLTFAALSLALAVGLASAVSPYASSSPDGLEKVADEQGFIDSGRLAPIQEGAPVPDYAFPGIENERVATGAAGFAGTLGVFAVAFGIASGLRRRARMHAGS